MLGRNSPFRTFSTSPLSSHLESLNRVRYGCILRFWILLPTRTPRGTVPTVSTKILSKVARSKIAFTQPFATLFWTAECMFSRTLRRWSQIFLLKDERDERLLLQIFSQLPCISYALWFPGETARRAQISWSSGLCNSYVTSSPLQLKLISSKLKSKQYFHKMFGLGRKTVWL